ncbi:hypothetical protein MBLNU13_g02897t1 [Cladosporium sp. NU13]
MHEEPSKKSLDEQVVMAGSVEAEKPAEEEVKLPKKTKEVKEEEGKLTAKKTPAVEEKIDLEDEPAVEQVPAKDVPSMEEKIEVEESPAAEQVTPKDLEPVKEKIEVEDIPVVEQEEKATSPVVLEDTSKQDKAQETVAEEAIVADALEEEAEDSDDHTEKALSDDGSAQRQSLQIDTQQDTTEDGTTSGTSLDDKPLVSPITEHITESPQPRTPTTPDDIRMSTASMASVPLSETDMSYDHLSAEQVEDFLATPRNNGSRHMRRPSSLEILGNCWEPARESTIFDASKPSAPPTPNLEQEEITDAGLDVGSEKPKSRKSNASSMVTTTRGSQSSEDEANEVDWKQLERHERQEKSDKDLPEGAEDDSTAFLLARLEQENAILTSDPKAATHKPVKRARGKSRPPSMAQLRKLVTQNDTPSIRYSLAPSMEVLEEPPPMTELEFWTALVQDYPSTAARLPTLTTSKIRAGIPPPLRGVVWASMAGARDRSLEDAFDRLLDEKSPYEGIINKDVGRSFPGVDLFRDAGGEGQKMLGTVLKCFSLHDKDIGYCQGLGFLVGPLLMNMGEREAFCVLVRLMDHYSLQQSFLPSLSGLHMRIYQFSALLKQLYPELSDHLTNMGIEPAYLSQWFLSCFAVTCPLPMLFRMYDVIFAEGANETVMRVALAIMRRNEQKLLASSEFEEVMHLLLGRTVFDSYGCNADELVDDFTSLDDVITHARLAELEKEFEMQSNEAVGEKAGFLPDVQAAASRFLGRLWAPSHSANKSTTTLSPSTAERERGGILRRSASKMSISTLNDSNDGNSSGVVSLSSTAPTETELDMTRDSMAETMSFRSKADSVRTQSAVPQAGISKEDRDMHSQIEDLLTALSEMQREHAQLAAMLQKEREDRNDDHRVVRQLVDRIQKGEEEAASPAEERRRTMPPPPREPTHNRQLSHPVKPPHGPKQELKDLIERVSGRLEVNSRFSTSLETKAQLRNTITRTRDQLAAEESRSRELVATIATCQAESEDLRSEVNELRTRVSEEFKERQRLEYAVRELQAQARVVERRELLSRTESGSDSPTLLRTDSNDNRRVSMHGFSSNGAGSGLRELKLGRRESSSSVPSLRNTRGASQTRQSPTSSAVSPPPTAVTFGDRTSSLNAQVAPEPEPSAADESLLLDLVNAKTAEAQARQEVDELRRSLAIQRRKQEEEKRLQDETLQRTIAELETARAEAQAWRSAESRASRSLGNSDKSLPGTPGEDNGLSRQSTPGPETPEKDVKPAPATTGGGWFWNRRTASTNQAKVLSP